MDSSPSSSVDNYASYAVFYDAAKDGRTARIRRIQQLLDEYMPTCTSVLELACGTAAILAGLDERYTKVGLDNSPAMLEHARKKLPTATLILGDMAELRLDRTFDAIFCTFNSIDHLPDFAAWRRMFQGVAEHLNPGGVFIFDTNSRERLAELAAQHTWHAPMLHGLGWIMSTVYALSNDTISWRIGHVVDGGMKYHQTLRLRTYDPERIKAALQRHFAILDIQTFSGDPMKQEDAGRIYFICRKPISPDSQEA